MTTSQQRDNAQSPADSDTFGRSGARRWWVLVVMCLAMLVLQMDAMVLNVALPTLATDLGADDGQLQLILTAYMVPFAGLLLLAGSLSDRFGRRRLLIIGLVVFGVASGFAAWAGNPEVLIATRFGMGVGGALMMPSTMSILIVSFPDETERRKAMSAFAVMSVLGLVGGPLVGGFLLQHFWWGSVFLLNVPLVVLALIAAATLLTESTGPARRFDPLGAALSMVWTATLIWAIVELPDGLTPPVLIALIVAGVSLAVFVVWEWRSRHPMVPIGLFGNRDFSGSCFSILLVMFAYGGFLLVLTQYLQSVQGRTPTAAALALLPVVIAMIVMPPIATAIGQRTGQKPLLLAGLLLLAAAFVLLALCDEDTGWWQLAGILALFGVGGGVAQPAAMTILTGAIPHEHAGVGSALNDTMLQTGSAFGVAVLGSILAGGYSGRLGEAPGPARESLAGALQYAAVRRDSALAQTARDAFVGSMQLTLAVSAAVVVLGAALAAALVRRRQLTPAAG